MAVSDSFISSDLPRTGAGRLQESRGARAGQGTTGCSGIEGNDETADEGGVLRKSPTADKDDPVVHPALSGPVAVERNEVGDVERDDDALLPGGQFEYLGVRAPSLASRLDDRTRVVATIT